MCHSKSPHLLSFILEGWQFDHHPQAPSRHCWLISFSWWSHYGWMQETSITFLIETPIPKTGQSTRDVSGKPRSSLPLALSTSSTSTLRMSGHLLRPVINHITLSQPSFGDIFFHTPHPLFYITCGGRGFQYLCHSVGMPWLPCICALFLYSFGNGSATFLHHIYSHLYMSCSTGPTDGTSQAKSYINGSSQGESLFTWLPTKE